MDTKPVAQTTGINTGLVLVYGHAIQPPYQVRVEHNKVLINEVPVGPGTTEKEILSESAAELRKKARRLFCEGSGKKTPETLAGEILALFKQADDTVIDAQWEKDKLPPAGILLVYWNKGLRQGDMRFSAAVCADRKPDNPEVMAADSRSHRLERYSGYYKKALGDRKLLFFGFNGHMATLPGDTIGKVNAAMKDGALGKTEQADKLDKLGFGPDGAREVMRNYEPH